MGLTRRDFLKRTGVVLAGAAVAGGAWTYVRGLVIAADPRVVQGAPNGNGATPAGGTTPAANPAELGQHRWGFLVDTTKCIGCGKCVEACKIENNVPAEPEFTRTWVERYVVTDRGETFVDSPEGGIHGFDSAPANIKYRGVNIVKSYFVPKLCNQCENTPCIQVCPVGATYRTEDGVVLVNRSRCIGCRYCVQACPYGARFLDPRYRVADKCTWCYHRISQGRNPACVDICPVGARAFGDLKDPNSPVSQALQRKRVNVLKPSLGTRPQVFYVGLEEEVR